VDKFDFTRGTRFSTYATWGVVKRFARTVPEENYRIQTYMTGSDEIIDVQPDESVTELERQENLEYMRAQIGEVLKHLPARDGEILTRRFGLDGKPQTLDQIGDALGITRERVRQLETRALRRAAEVIGQYHG
jgi:RNA polymerase primary sigma factor